MAFTFNPVQPLSPEQVNPFHSAIQNAFRTYGQGVKAAYAPKMLDADIFSKQFAPLAQIASNPLAMAMMPDQGKQMMTMLSQMLQQQGGANGGAAPQGGGGQGGLWQSILSRFQGQNGDANPPSAGSGTGAPAMGSAQPSPATTGGSGDYGSVNQASPQEVRDIANHGNNAYNPNLPQAGGSVGQGATARAIAPTEESIHGAGTTFYDPATNKTYSTPTGGTIEVAQKSLNAVKRVIPQLQNLAGQSQEFLKFGGKLGVGASQLSGILANYGVMNPETAKKMGIDPEKVSRYAAWQGNEKLALDSLMSAFPNIPQTDQSLTTMAHALEPLQGENSKGYAARILKTAENLSSQQIPALSNQMSQPIDVSGQGQGLPPGMTPVDEPGTAYDSTTGAGGATRPMQLNKSHVTEENIAETIRQTGLSRKEVMKQLKAKGLV